MKKEVKFNLDEDILFQIAMMTYDECNSEIATIYDHLGEEYGYSDLQAAKEYELRYEKDLLEKAVSQLQARSDKYKNQQKEFINYINAYIELLKDKPDLVEEGQKDILEEILSKYKKIIGGKE